MMARSFWVLCLFFACLVCWGQTAPSSGLRSSDWRERQRAFRLLADRKDRSAEENAALAGLLLSEFTQTASVRPEVDSSPDNDHLIDPAKEEYIGALVNTAVTIADEDPSIPGVWPALLAAAAYNGHSGMMPWLASHSDRTAPYFLACVRGEAPCPRPYDALFALAKIIVYERDPATRHHLRDSEVELLDRAIRARLNAGSGSPQPTEANELMRMKAIEALGVIGNGEDLKWLEQVAATDPYYPFRFDAGLAASVLRKSLAAREAGVQ